MRDISASWVTTPRNDIKIEFVLIKPKEIGLPFVVLTASRTFEPRVTVPRAPGSAEPVVEKYT